LTKQQIESEISQWQRGQVPLNAIEKLRDALVKAVEERKAQHGGFNREQNEDDEEKSSRSSLMSLLADASGFDALISGDGMINRNAQLTDRNGISRNIYTIIDVIDHLARSGKIDGRRRNGIRRTLREAGIALVPLEIEEVMEAATQSDWSRGPGIALRAIVTSIHLPTLRKAILLPEEQYWLGNAFSVMTIAIKRCWAVLPSEAAEDAATWLLKSLPDPHDLLDSNASPEVALWASNVRTAMHAMLAQPVDVPFERLEGYWHWYFSLVGPQLGGRDRLVAPLVDNALKQNIASAEAFEVENKTIPAIEVRQWLFQRLPDTIRRRLLRDKTVSDSLGFENPKQRIGDHRIGFRELVEFIRMAFAGEARPLVDIDGSVVASKGTLLEDGDLAIETDQGTVRIDFAGLLNPDDSVREKVLEKLLSKRTLPLAAAAAWIQANAIGPLGTGELGDLLEALARAPQAWIHRNRIEDDLRIQDLAIESDGFYLPFIEYEKPISLSEVFEKTLRARMGLPGLAAAARLFAPLAISPDFRITDFANELVGDSALQLVRELIDDGDPFSLIAAFQISCAKIADDQFRAEASAIFLQLIATSDYCEKIAHDYSACAFLILGYADARGTLASLPLPLRRAALLLHAAWAVRVLKAKDIQRPQFFEDIEEWIGSTYRLSGLVDRKEGRWWFREWLRPEIMAGLIRSRMKGIARSVPQELRPNEWDQHIANTNGGKDLREFASGPLDEFSEAWRTNTFPSKDFCSAIEGVNDEQAKNALFNVLLAFEMPDDPQQARQKVLNLLNNASGEELVALTNLALMAGARWRDTELAKEALRYALQYGIKEGWSMRFLGEWCVAAAFVGGERSYMIEQMEESLAELMDRDLEPAQASELIGLIDKLIDLVPEARALRRLRSAALLAT
jgi:hypothetical protein